MKWKIKPNKHVNIRDGQWHKAFALFPRQISKDDMIWFESYWFRYVVDSEGNWAGGYQYHWEYRIFDCSKEIWKGRLVHD